MFAVMGVTGNVGGVVAETLLGAGTGVRAIVRDKAKATRWMDRGAETAVADLFDVEAMTQAFTGVEGVFVMIPPVFDPAADFSEARAAAEVLTKALGVARPGRVVYLSTVGAQARETNLLSQHTLIEGELRRLDLPITFLRPAWFMENAQWDVASAREAGVIRSFLTPLDRPVAMVATADIGQVAGELLQEAWSGHRVVELEGPEPVTPSLIGAAFGDALGKAVRVEAVPRQEWEMSFRAQGMKNPYPRMRMLDGFNEGWISFEGSAVRKGTTGFASVVRRLVDPKL